MLAESPSPAQLKVIAENLKNIMVTIKSNLPSRVGKELLPAEDSTLYREAFEQVRRCALLLLPESPAH